MPDDRALKQILKSQYHAALAMLRNAVAKCPDELWYDATPTNAFWQVAYHTMFFAHFYLQPNEAAFRPWQEHQGNVQHIDGIGYSLLPTLTSSEGFTTKFKTESVHKRWVMKSADPTHVKHFSPRLSEVLVGEFGRRLTLAYCEILMGFPQGWLTDFEG